MALLSITGAHIGTVGSGRRSSWRIGDEGEAAAVVEAAAVESRTRRREGGENTRRRTQWQAKRCSRIVGQWSAVR